MGLTLELARYVDCTLAEGEPIANPYAAFPFGEVPGLPNQVPPMLAWV